MNNWNKKFTFYAVALYRIGNYTDAAVIGSIMFEKAVYYLLENRMDFDPDRIKEEAQRRGKGPLQSAIDLLFNDESDRNNRDHLHDLRIEVRNKIVHKINLNEIKRNNIVDMLKFIWETFDPDTYKKFDKEIPKIDFLTADFAVMDVRELLNRQESEPELFTKFETEDFKELYKLRKKFISLKPRIEKDLLQDNIIEIDILSKIDTTSAYVWMSMHKNGQERQRISAASVSILGTPLDLRIYMDFGGEAIEERQNYFNFLKTKDFRNFWRKKKRGMTAPRIKDIQIFNIDWFSFVFDQALLENELEKNTMIENIRKAERELKENQNNKVTWNRMLCGYIIPRKTIEYQDIKNKLAIIIQFYDCFEEYIKRNKG